MKRPFQPSHWSMPLLVGVAWLIGAPSAAWGACISTNEVATFDPGPIPVYVSNGLSHIRQAGLELDDASDRYDSVVELRWVRAAIDMINASSADGPRLYYAGTDYLDHTPNVSEVNPGITIASFGSCQIQPPTGLAQQTASGNRALIRFRRGGFHGCDRCSGNSDPCSIDAHCPSGQTCLDTCDWENDPSSCFSWWVDPDETVTQSAGTNRFFVGVIAHELLHALGLGHSNIGLLDWGDSCLPPYDPAVASLMNVSTSQFRKYWRTRLRRDDIEGLRTLYGAPERTISWSTSTQVPPNKVSWSTPVQINPATLATNTPVGLTSASNTADEWSVAGFTNPDDEVRFFSGQGSTWSSDAVDGQQVQTNTGGPIISHDPVGVAFGYPWDAQSSAALRLLVSWVGGPDDPCCGEDVQDAEVRVWWRVLSDGTWKGTQGAGYTHFKPHGVGYDPRTDHFVLGYIDTYPTGSTEPEDAFLHVRTIKAWNGGGGCWQAFTSLADLHPYEVGDVACDYTGSGAATRCVIPVASLTDEGPIVQYVEGTIDTFVGLQCFIKDTGTPLTVAGADSYGKLGSAFSGYNPFVFGDPTSGIAQYVGTRVVGRPDETPDPAGYSVLYTMERTASGLSGVMANERTFDTNYWPLRVGSQSFPSGSVRNRWRVMLYE